MTEREAKGVLDNTLVVFTSDNGYILGDHRIPGEKNKLYEGAAHVPLLVRGPGFTPGTVVDSVVANIDLTKTIVETTGFMVASRRAVNSGASTRRRRVWSGGSLRPRPPGSWSALGTPPILARKSLLNAVWPARTARVSS